MEDKYIDKGELDKTLEAYIENEVERRIKDYPVYIAVKGESVEADVEYSDGQINVNIPDPIFFENTGRVAFIHEAPTENEAWLIEKTQRQAV